MSKPAPTKQLDIGVAGRPLPAEWEIYQANLKELAILATQLALEAPERLSPSGYTCTVNKATITRVRVVLERMGLDWKAEHKKLRLRK